MAEETIQIKEEPECHQYDICCSNVIIEAKNDSALSCGIKKEVPDSGMSCDYKTQENHNHRTYNDSAVDFDHDVKNGAGGSYCGSDIKPEVERNGSKHDNSHVLVKKESDGLGQLLLCNQQSSAFSLQDDPKRKENHTGI